MTIPVAQNPGIDHLCESCHLETRRKPASSNAAGEFLLTKDICKHSIMFGPKGLYQDRNDTFGIGYEVNLDELSRYGQLESGDALPVNEVKR